MNFKKKIEEKKERGNTKGITLISLIITIIVLLILATVTILALTRDNGLFSKARESRIETGHAQVLEQVKLYAQDYFIKSANESVNSDLREYFKDSSIGIVNSDNTLSLDKLLQGKSLNTGKGTEENKDVYKILKGKEIDTETVNLNISGVQRIQVGNIQNSAYYVVYFDRDSIQNILGRISDSSASTQVAVVPPSAYGCKVTNYREGEDWEILYQGAVEEGGESRIYLIKSNADTISNIDVSKYEGVYEFDGSKLFKNKFPAVAQGLLYKIYDYDGTIKIDDGYSRTNGYTYEEDGKPHENIKATEFFLDSSLEIWKNYKDTRTFKYADYVIGAPTLELLVASYNSVNPSMAQQIPDLDPQGYVEDDYFYTNNPLINDGITPWNHGEDYWLACPSNYTDCWEYNFVRQINKNGYIKSSLPDYSELGAVRPVVCLKDGLELKENITENGTITYTIEEVEVLDDDDEYIANLEEKTDGSFTYVENENGIKITGLDSNNTNINIVVTQKIGGKNVTAIGRKAFYENTNITSITIPDSVTTIEPWAFYRCSSLNNVIIPNSVTHLGRDVFSECSSLESVKLPDGLDGIPRMAFYGCQSLKHISIPDSVKWIGEAAFCGSGLEEVSLPESMTVIDNNAFFGCRSLVTINMPKQLSELGYGVFDNDYALELNLLQSANRH